MNEQTPPSLSVLIPNFNHARFLPDSLGSVARQDPPPRELIVVDDGSTDDSVSVIEGLAKKHPFITLLRQETNQGFAAALRRGLAHSRTRWVSIMAADDLVLPGFIGKTLPLLARYPDAGMCTFLAKVLDHETGALHDHDSPKVLPEAGFISPREFLAAYLEHGSWIVTYSAIYRRDIILESGAFDVPREREINSDGFLNFYAPAKHGICFIPEPLAIWRRMERSYAFRTMEEDMCRAVDVLEERLRSPKCAGLFPEAFITAWKRRSFLMNLYEQSRRRADPVGIVSKTRAWLKEPMWLDRLYFLALRLGLGPRLLTRAYLSVNYRFL